MQLISLVEFPVQSPNTFMMEMQEPTSLLLKKRLSEQEAGLWLEPVSGLKFPRDMLASFGLEVGWPLKKELTVVQASSTPVIEVR